MKHKPWRPRGAFSLVELLVVISVIAILIAIAAPALRGAIGSARVTRHALTSRQVYMALMSYTEDFRETFPYYATPGNFFGPLTFGETVVTDGAYFATQRYYWATSLVPNYIEARALIEPPELAAVLAERGRPDLILASTTISSTVHADPKVFTGEWPGQPFDPAVLRATRTHEVTFPSDKIVLIEWWGTHVIPAQHRLGDEVGFPAVFGDGSGQTLSEAQIIQMPSVEVPNLGNIPVHTTLDGLRGRDRPALAPDATSP